MRHGQRVHVPDRSSPGRVLCGRREAGQARIDLDQAERRADLCRKCRQQIPFARMLIRIAREPKAAGFQYSLFEVW